MTINKISQYGAYCDRCNDIFTYDGYNKKDAIKDLRSHGWSIGILDICPRCKSKPKVSE